VCALLSPTLFKGNQATAGNGGAVNAKGSNEVSFCG
jgi:predicted outer membrane repeat protein